jgi:hypothetical protein
MHPPRTSVSDNTVGLSRSGGTNLLVHFFDSLYALTLKKKRIVAFFSAVTLTQFLMGMYMVGITAQKPGMRLIDWLPPVLMLSFLSPNNAGNISRGI